MIDDLGLIEKFKIPHDVFTNSLFLKIALILNNNI